MRPDSMQNNKANKGIANVITGSEGCIYPSLRTKFAHLYNLLFGKFGFSVGRAPMVRYSAPTFIPCIPHVIGLCAEEQVVGSNTGGGVTLVQDTKAFARSTGNCVGVSMRWYKRIVTYTQFGGIKSAISVDCTPSPEPAGISFINLSPKALFNGDVCCILIRHYETHPFVVLCRRTFAASLRLCYA